MNHFLPLKIRIVILLWPLGYRLDPMMLRPQELITIYDENDTYSKQSHI